MNHAFVALWVLSKQLNFLSLISASMYYMSEWKTAWNYFSIFCHKSNKIICCLPVNHNWQAMSIIESHINRQEDCLVCGVFSIIRRPIMLIRYHWIRYKQRITKHLDQRSSYKDMPHCHWWTDIRTLKRL